MGKAGLGVSPGANLVPTEECGARPMITGSSHASPAFSLCPLQVGPVPPRGSPRLSPGSCLASPDLMFIEGEGLSSNPGKGVAARGLRETPSPLGRSQETELQGTGASSPPLQKKP